MAGARKVIARLPDRELPLTLSNLSMSGAQLAYDARARPETALETGARLELTIIDPFAPESVELQAEVVRQTQGSQPAGFAVRFLELELATAQRLEGLILDLLVSRVA